MGPSERKGWRSTGLASLSVSAASGVITELIALASRESTTEH